MRSEVVAKVRPAGGPARHPWLAGGVRVWGTAALGLGAACGGTVHAPIAPPPPKQTHAVLAGSLCEDNRCTCRGDQPGDGGAGVPEGRDRKRFELRLTSPYDLWVTINRTAVFYKSPERAEACFYVDLPTGAQDVELRASNPDGVSAGLQIHELGTRTRSWYDTFSFSCGVPGVCSFDELEANKAQYSGVKRQLFDRCGTTKAKAISWDHGQAPDQLHPSELVVRLTLDIYKFAAWKPHGDPTCGEGGGRRGPADEPSPDPGEVP